jgi:hypothetical protein
MTAAGLVFIVLAQTGAGATDVEVLQRNARRQLTREFARIATQARRFSEQAAAHEEACGGLEPPRSCGTRVSTLRRRAADLRAQIDAAEDAGRQGWLIPGEVRALRRQAIDDIAWDATLLLVERWRNATPPLGELATRPSRGGRSRRR